MLAEHLVNMAHIRIGQCKYETVKPLASFKNLESIDLDFNPPRDELTYIFE